MKDSPANLTVEAAIAKLKTLSAPHLYPGLAPLVEWLAARPQEVAAEVTDARAMLRTLFSRAAKNMAFASELEDAMDMLEAASRVPATSEMAPVSVSDFKPHFPECDTPEPSLSALIYRYYRQHFEDRATADGFASRYIVLLDAASRVPVASAAACGVNCRGCKGCCGNIPATTAPSLEAVDAIALPIPGGNGIVRVIKTARSGSDPAMSQDEKLILSLHEENKRLRAQLAARPLEVADAQGPKVSPAFELGALDFKRGHKTNPFSMGRQKRQWAAGYTQAVSRVPVASGLVQAWEYQNLHGDKFLTFNDPANWHDKNGFKNFMPLAYAPAPAPGGAGGDVGAKMPKFTKEWCLRMGQLEAEADGEIGAGQLATPAPSVPLGGDEAGRLLERIRVNAEGAIALSNLPTHAYHSIQSIAEDALTLQSIVATPAVQKKEIQ